MLEQNRQKLESEQRFRALIENGTDLILVLDANGICHYASPSLGRILGYGLNEIIGKSVFELVHSDDVAKLDQIFDYALKTPRSHLPIAEYRVQHSDGSWSIFEAVLTNLLDHPAVRGVVMNSHDVTERKYSEAALKQAATEAEAANRAKSAFLANMSHELRTPLSVIIGYSDMLLEEALAVGDKDTVRDLKQIRTAGAHLLTLINDILDISKLEAGQMRLYLEPFSIASLIKEIVSTTQPIVDGNGNTLKVDLPSNLDVIYGDATKLRQALLNLLNNAAKFTQHGKIILTVSEKEGEPEAADGKESRWIVFQVQDTGIGIAAEQLPHLFEAFTQADVSISRIHSGTGLGLAISRRLCEMMGGKITVESEVGVGSTFRIYLPAGMTNANTKVAAEEDDTE
ncbi:PAS domain-containing sensor histidine kinase [Microcoleus sp. FACHB-672]|uniref:PAS domain-containing sensor histidine kinase n=1 Tax=Microcoleus sp. FACHB-672 TaxID=2692825 RepID=UPI001684BD3D|nr:PAS domain-containing sensor histidine kinase [Microcoleus sp. FACHB-672]MBD2040193.1 PAS domain-containing sensor histidine kinase [Microcoleus sp. FACHB-672]